MYDVRHVIIDPGAILLSIYSVDVILVGLTEYDLFAYAAVLKLNPIRH